MSLSRNANLSYMATVEVLKHRRMLKQVLILGSNGVTVLSQANHQWADASNGLKLLNDNH